MRADRRTLLKLLAVGAVAPALPAWAEGFPRPDRELMAPVPGGRVYVRVNGDLAGPRPPLVVIHGGPGGTHASYLPLLEMAGERAIILYDQLDSGRSDHPNDPANWRVDRFVAELPAIAAALGIRRWHVMGHSWGGTIALEYAASRPAALAGLILAGPLISTRSWIADADALRRQLPAEIQATLRACDPPAELVPACGPATEAFYGQFNRRVPPSAALQAYEASESGRGSNGQLYRAMWGSSEFVATGTLKDYDGEPLLARLDGARTLFLVGQYDEARPVTTAAFAARVPGADFAVVPGAAHGTVDDRPQETLGLLRPWLARQDAPAKG